MPIVAAGDDDTEMGMAELFFGGWLPIPEQLSFSERFRDGLVINNVSNEMNDFCVVTVMNALRVVTCVIFGQLFYFY